jgi:hypothetical protein
MQLCHICDSVDCFGDLLRSEWALNGNASPDIESDKLSMRARALLNRIVCVNFCRLTRKRQFSESGNTSARLRRDMRGIVPFTNT